MLKFNNNKKIGGGYLLKPCSDSILRSLKIFVLNFRLNVTPHRHPELYKAKRRGDNESTEPVCAGAQQPEVSGSQTQCQIKRFRTKFGMTSI